jgi:hypothetical protein
MAILILVLSSTSKFFRTFDEALFIYIESVFKLFYDALLILGAITLFFILPFTVIGYNQRFDEFEQIRIETLYLIGILLTGVILTGLMLKKKGELKNSIWRNYQKILADLKAIEQEYVQSNILILVKRVKTMVAFVSIMFLLFTFSGIADLYIYFLLDAFYSSNKEIYLIIPFLKIVISLILMLGSYFLMVAPLNKIKFWKNVVLEKSG